MTRRWRLVRRVPSTAYRLKKFIHRNRAMVTAVGAVAAALVLGIIGFAWQASVANYQRDLANQARESEAEQRKLAEAARVEAENQKTRALEQEAEAKKQAAIAEAVAKFQTDMLAAVDPNQLPRDPVTKEPLKEAVTVLQAMTAAVKALDAGSLKDQPLVEADVRETIGNTLFELARYAEAEPNLRKSLEIRRAALPAGHPDIAAGLNNLAVLLQAQNKLAEAESFYREALEIWRAALPAGHPDIALGLNGLASLLYDQNKLAEAEPLLREALAIKRAAFPAGHPDIALGLNNLASLYWRQGKLDQSIPMFEEALKTTEAAFGRRHPDTLRTVANLGVNYKDAGRLAEAIPLLEEAYRASQMHAAPRWVSAQLRDAYAKSGETTKVNDLIQEQLAEARTSLPTESPQLAGQLAQFSMVLLTLKAWDEAEPLIREALTIREGKEPDDWRTFNTKSMLGGVLLGQKKYAEAEPLLLAGYEGLQLREAAIPPNGKIRIPEALERLVLLYTDWHAAEPDKGHDAKAAEWQTKLREHQAAANAEPSPTTGNAK